MTQPKTTRTPAKPSDQITFDALDRKILDMIQVNSDVPISVIAEAVGLTPTPCWRRIKRMEEAGLISKRVAIVDHAMAKVPMTVFIGISTPRHEKDWIDRFRTLIDEIPEIIEAYRLTGTVDYILKVVVPDVTAYDAVYKRMVDKLDFTMVNGMISMEEMKFTTAVPTKYL
ncbi:MAG: Lrp/AsnC family transcriptional regulator [Sagittula sp.]|jgi:Lrp/AsnC family transcriptional regulator|uniref:Lrp/AsnC family transcriptional regulator n=1 Tax=Roseobacteraceae TaxID=2854170 RepID=UPI000C2D5D0B|nr:MULTISPECIES: Lrp/AsnC family transcriptional regulator [unclassified Sagittula]AUC56259.1 ArsR family transcriptional regulator [Sagittula sp. P11]WHZ38161.1 Lrp/AsnC family transcriptional regulator [Sagittula sp. MA-2]